MLMLEADLARFNPLTLQMMIDALPPGWAQRVTRKQPFDARLRSAVGYSLLGSILQSEYGIYDLPTISVDEFGRPYLENSDLFFSISHCKSAVACVVEDCPVAVDVQDILSDPSGRLKARIGAPADLDDHTLTALWTQKEASAKLDGRGLRIPLTDLPLAHHMLETVDHGTYYLTIAHNNKPPCL